jgi:hypothetical protein
VAHGLLREHQVEKRQALVLAVVAVEPLILRRRAVMVVLVGFTVPVVVVAVWEVQVAAVTALRVLSSSPIHLLMHL